MILNFRKTSRIEDPGSSRVRDTRNKKTKEFPSSLRSMNEKNAHKALPSVAFILGALLLKSGGSTIKLRYFKEFPFGLCPIFPLIRTVTKFSNMMAIDISI